MQRRGGLKRARENTQKKRRRSWFLQRVTVREFMKRDGLTKLRAPGGQRSDHFFVRAKKNGSCWQVPIDAPQATVGFESHPAKHRERLKKKKLRLGPNRQKHLGLPSNLADQQTFWSQQLSLEQRDIGVCLRP